MTYVYVLLAAVENQRIPLAAFDNRQRCEYAVEEELAGWLRPFGLRLQDCGFFVVEQWLLNGPLDQGAVRTLTAYDNDGRVSKYLVPQGREG